MLIVEQAARLSRQLPPVRGKVNLAWWWKRRIERAGQLSCVWEVATDGMKFELPASSSMAWSVAFGVPWDAPYRQHLRQYEGAGTLVLDVGASLGLWTVPLALDAVRTGSRVWAFEPMADHRRWLQRNLELNGVHEIVDVHDCALGRTRGTVRMGTVDVAEANAAVALSPREAGPAVRVVRLDDLPRPHRVSLIKIDAEGYEPEILRGAVGVLEQDRPVVFGEFSREWLRMRNEDLRPLLRDFAQLGYEVFALEPQRSRPWRQVDRVVRVPVTPDSCDVADNLLLLPR